MLTDLDYDLLSAYIDDALSDSERTAFERRLQNEPELRSELDELRATVTLLNSLPTLKAPRDFTLDARYARRTSTFFFTSAAFTALSSAAAIILFALGAYLFAGRSGSQAPLASTSQEVQLAFVATSTSATTLDKAAAATPTDESLQNENAITETSSNSQVPIGGVAATDGLADTTTSAEPSAFPAAPPLIEPDTSQPPGNLTINPTNAPTAGFLFGDQRTEDATETALNDQFASSADSAASAAGAVGAAVPSPLEQTGATGGESNASSAFAATQPPMTATALPTSAPASTATALPAMTFAPSATLTETVTPQPTDSDTPVPTIERQVAQQQASSPDILPLIVIVLGAVFLLIAVVSTIIRRRNRP